MYRAWCACGAFLLLSACSLVDPHHTPSIAGNYRLVTVDGQAIPCCTHTDTTTGVQTTALSGQLTLGNAPPESFEPVPAGILMPASCVYLIPNGARVHADTVFRTNGSWYLLSPCGRGSYAMTLTERVDSAGRSDTTTVNYSGRYSWSSSDSLVYLVGSMSGPFTQSSGGLRLTLQQTHFPFPQRYYPTYGFAP